MLPVLSLTLLLLPAAPQVHWTTEKTAEKGWWTTKLTYPVIDSESPVCTLANRLFKQTAVAARNDQVKSFREMKPDSDRPEYGWCFEATCQLSVVGDNLVSGYFSYYYDGGGAHPNRAYGTLTVGLVDGKAKALGLVDLLRGGVTPKQIAEEFVLPALNVQKQQREAESLDELDAKLLDSFVLTPTSVTWLFEPYATGSYAEGDYLVKLHRRALEEVLVRGGPLAPLPVPAG